MRFFAFFILIAIIGPAFAFSAPEDLELPFEDEGACPFECCTYRQWTVARDTVLQESPRIDARESFSLKKGEPVKGLTGIVITLKPGRAVVKKAVTLGLDDRVTTRAGDVLNILHYEGEGVVKFWLRGKTYSDELPFPGEENESIKTETAPETLWWVQVQNTKGRTGWSKEPDHFDHMDSCE
jgi:hypothetical protein